MKLGIIIAQDFSIHFNEILAELEKRHEMAVFCFQKWPYQIMSERINRRLLNAQLGRFLGANDLVFFEWGEEFFVRATRLKKRCKIAARLHLHEVWDFAERADLTRVDRFIFVSEAMRAKFGERFPEAAGRAAVVHNGVNTERFAPAERNYQGVIGTLGRIEPHKRIYDLILVLNELRRQGFDLRLKIGGSCSEPRYQRYADEVQLLAKRLGIQDYVQFDGQVTNTPAWFKEVDIFISHSVSEGLQVALLEAMASGCGCLAHAWDGAEEALPPENIYISEGELVEKVKHYAALGDMERQKEKDKLRAIAVERFNIEIQKKKVVQIIEETLGVK